jgi:hypothetical protein
MKTEITAAKLRRRRQELTDAIADEIERGEFTARKPGEYFSPIERYRIRLVEVDRLLAHIGSLCDHGGHLAREPGTRASRTKPHLRYRWPGATTDLVRLAYATPGIELEALVTAVYDSHKTQGTRRETIRKMVLRLIRERYAYREGSRLYLAEVGRKAWEASPLYSAP